MKLTDEQIQEIAMEHLQQVVGYLNTPAAPLDDNVDPFIFIATLGLNNLSWTNFK
jgi:hypothetical protein